MSEPLYMKQAAPQGIDPGTHELLLAAIRKKRLIRFSLGGKPRVVEPHDYGIYKGIVRLLAFQISGASSGPLPGWRWIDVDRISDAAQLDQTFAGGRRVAGKHHAWEVVFARVSPS